MDQRKPLPKRRQQDKLFNTPEVERRIRDLMSHYCAAFDISDWRTHAPHPQAFEGELRELINVVKRTI